MKRRVWLTKERLRNMYTTEHLTCKQISEKIELSERSIARRLKKYGISTHAGEWVKVKCSFCGIDFEILRGRWKKNKNPYCCAEHYWASLENPAYVRWDYGSRLARAIVSQYIKLGRDVIVHHEDGNCKNNDRANLKAFKDQGDHIKYHRLSKKPKPVWDGSIL